MTELQNDLILWCAILGIKCAAMAQAIGCLRVNTVQYRAPEDFLLDPTRNQRIIRQMTSSNSSNNRTEYSQDEMTWPDRLQRIQQNDVENIPLFLVLAAVYTVALSSSSTCSTYDKDKDEEHGFLVVEARRVLWVYGIARLLFTGFYLAKIQPHRTMTFAFGLAAHYYLCGMLARWAIWSHSTATETTTESVAALSTSWLYQYLPAFLLLPLLGQMIYYLVESPGIFWLTLMPVRASSSSASRSSESSSSVSSSSSSKLMKEPVEMKKQS